MTSVGRKPPLISDFLTTALEKLLPKFDGETQILKIHTPSPGYFPLAVIPRITGN